MNDEKIRQYIKKYGLYIDSKTELNIDILNKLKEYNIDKYFVIGVNSPRFDTYCFYKQDIYKHTFAISDYIGDIYQHIKTETDNKKIVFYYKNNRIAICNHMEINNAYLKYYNAEREEKLKRILYG